MAAQRGSLHLAALCGSAPHGAVEKKMCRQAAVHPALRRILSCRQPFVFFLVIPHSSAFTVTTEEEMTYSASSRINGSG
jgi:hypothetical protein